MSETKKHILHVDDDEDILSFISAILVDIAQVTSVKSTKEARAILTGSTFDLFILDLVLQDGSGSSMARTLKKAYPNTPIVILSAHNLVDAIEEADITFMKGCFDKNTFIDYIKKALAI